LSLKEKIRWENAKAFLIGKNSILLTKKEKPRAHDDEHKGS